MIFSKILRRIIALMPTVSSQDLGLVEASSVSVCPRWLVHRNRTGVGTSILGLGSSAVIDKYQYQSRLRDRRVHRLSVMTRSIGKDHRRHHTNASYRREGLNVVLRTAEPPVPNTGHMF
ncbi:hypothetical protein SISSUDRAFT_763785 [Sistotremastrum suecicum HHB10207 ss-3]|uniref:Uncharacterized protein n=1 Tax=Sistotremastrum suecicum HHB10207 ss-3 TaxID=1314776 RepID=A0A165WNA2_9AGAM|nr:hypothetical protein SISSUDRAFT_763785 [Sistotremastrum suecicum HHB10207 ss-3]